MEQQIFSNFVQGLTMELRNAVGAISKTLRGESLLKNIRTLENRRDGGYRVWLQEIEKYFRIVGAGDEEKCQAALLTTRGQVGLFINGLMANNEGLTWLELKRGLEDYFGIVANPNKNLIELANIRQGRDESVQDYMQRIVRLAEGAYSAMDANNELVKKQVLGFFIEGLRDKDVKMAVMRDEPTDLHAAYEKALAEVRWKIRLNANREYDDEPMEVCHARRQVRVEAVGPAKFPKQDRWKRLENKGPVYKTREKEKN